MLKMHSQLMSTTADDPVCIARLSRAQLSHNQCPPPPPVQADGEGQRTLKKVCLARTFDLNNVLYIGPTNGEVHKLHKSLMPALVTTAKLSI